MVTLELWDVDNTVLLGMPVGKSLIRGAIYSALCTLRNRKKKTLTCLFIVSLSLSPLDDLHKDPQTTQTSLAITT